MNSGHVNISPSLPCATEIIPPLYGRSQYFPSLLFSSRLVSFLRFPALPFLLFPSLLFSSFDCFSVVDAVFRASSTFTLYSTSNEQPGSSHSVVSGCLPDTKLVYQLCVDEGNGRRERDMADVSSVSPSSERQPANARNVSHYLFHGVHYPPHQQLIHQFVSRLADAVT